VSEDLSRVAKAVERVVDEKVSKALKRMPRSVSARVVGKDGEGKIWVLLPGAESPTPVKHTYVDVREGDRVAVTVGDGKAVITSNATNPAAGIVEVNVLQQSSERYEMFQKVITEDLEAKTAKIGYLEADTAKIHHLTADELEASVAYIDDLTARHIAVEDLEADHAVVNNLEANYAHITDGVIDNAKIGHADVEDLDANYAHITSGVIDNATIDHADVNDLNANYAHITNGTIDNATIGYANVNDLDAHYAEIDFANVANGTIVNAMIKDGTIETAKIKNAAITTAKIKDAAIETAKIKDAAITTAKIGSAAVRTAQIANAAITSALIANEAVGDAQIANVSANKLTAGTIDADTIHVTNLSTDNLKVKKVNGQPILGGYSAVSNKTGGYSSKNPATEGWYELNAGNFVLTQDTTVAPSKVYYAQSESAALYDQATIDGMVSDLNDRIDAQIETWTEDHVPTLNNSPASSWNTDDLKAEHVGDICYVINAGNDYDGYTYRFAYDNASSAYKWVLIKDNQVTAALGRISDLETFESNTTSWIEETDEGLTTIRTNHTNLSGVVDKTVKETVQLWFTKADTTAPSAPTAQVTNNNVTGSNSYNKWNLAVPSYNASYPNYFYCYQWKYVDNSYGWSAVTRDIGMSEVQANSRTALTQSVEYIAGTHGSTATNVWTGVTTDAALYAGKTIAFYMPSAGTTSAATLNLTLSGGGTTGAKNVRMNNSNVTNQYPQYTVLKLTYDGTYWKSDNYNADTYNRTKFDANLVAAEAITGGHLVCGTENGYRDLAASLSFDLTYPLLYAATTIAKAATTGTRNNNYLEINNIAYTNNGTVEGAAAGKTVYLKGTVSGNTFTTEATNFLTCVVPTVATDPETYYIPLGIMTSATNGYFKSNDRLYAYINGVFQPVDTAASLKASAAQATADANIKSSTMLWFSKANNTAPSKPNAQVTSTSTAGNAWRIVVPTYDASYPHYFYCYQQQRGDGTYQWTDVVYDRATTETQSKAQAALPAATFTTFQSTTFKELVDEVDEQSSTITSLSTQVDTAISMGTEYIVGTHGTTATNVWTGVTQDTALYAGKTIAFYMTSAGLANTAATLNLQLDNGNGEWTGAKNVRINNSNVTTHYPQGTVVKLTYDGTYWKCDNYDSNTYDRERYNVNVTAAAAISAGRIGVFGTDGVFKMLSASAFDTTRPILYIGTAYTASALTQTNNYTYYGAAFNLTNTHSVQGATAGKAVYIVGTMSGNTFTPNSTVLTCTEPTTQDNLYYMRLGIMTTTANAVLESQHPIYSYVVDANGNGSFQQAAPSVVTTSNTVNSVKQTADSNSAHISNLTTTLGTNADGTTASNDIVHKWNDIDQTLDGVKTVIGYSENQQGQGSSTLVTKVNEIDETVDGHTQSIESVTTTLTEGGRNLVGNSGTYEKWLITNSDNVTFDGEVVDINVANDGANHFRRAFGYLVEENLTSGTFTLSFEVYCDDWSGVGSPDSSTTGYAYTVIQLCYRDGTMWPASYSSIGATKRYKYMSLSGASYWEVQPTQENSKWLRFVSKPLTFPDDLTSDSSKGTGPQMTVEPMLRGWGHVKFRHIQVERGEIATTWSPSPYDLTSIDRKYAEYVMTNEQFKTTVGETYATKTSLANTQASVLKTGGLGMRVNASTISNTNNGECYLHGFDSDYAVADVDGWVMWNGSKVTIPKGMWVNHNNAHPFNITVYIVYRTSNTTFYAVYWSDTSKKWLGSSYNASGMPQTASDFAWANDTDIILGSYVATATEGAISSATLFDPPKHFSELGEQLVSRVVTAETQIEQNTEKISLTAKKVETSTNMLLDADASSLTAVYAPAGRYWSNGSYSDIITCEFFELTDSPDHDIKYGIRLTGNGTNTVKRDRGIGFYNVSNTTALSLVPGQKYVASFWARCTSGSAYAFVTHRYKGTSNKVALDYAELTSTWQLYTADVMLESLPTDYNRIWFQAAFDANTVGVVEMCGFKLVPQLYASQAELKVANDAISLRVEKDGVIGAINLSSENATISADKVNIAGAALFTSGALSKVVTSQQNQFYSSTSQTSLAGGSWADTQPTIADGRYIWQRTYVTYSNGDTAYIPNSTGVCITQNPDVGGRNLVLWSNDSSKWTRYQPNTYNLAIFELSEDLVPGDTYTLTIWGGPITRSDKEDTKYAVYWGGGNFSLGNCQLVKTGVYSLTFTVSTTNTSQHIAQSLHLYNTPSVGASGTVYSAPVTKVKLEQGAVATAWTPAPEDVTAYIDSVADELEVSSRNLIRNGNFAEGTSYWTAKGTLTTEADSTYGNIGIFVQANAGSANDRLYTTGSGVNFDHASSTTYSFSCYAKASAANTLRVNRARTSDVYVNKAITTSWQRFEGTVTSTGTGSLTFELANAGTLYLANVMLVRGDKPMDYQPDPRDVVLRTQRIYYRSSSSTKPSAPSTWVTEVGNQWASNATTAAKWTTKVTPITASGSTTKYLYLWTCVQSRKGDGSVENSGVLLDDSTTVIDGGSIITNSIDANKINVASINIGDLSGSVGGRNLALGTATASTCSRSGSNSYMTPMGMYGVGAFGLEQLADSSNTKFTVSFDWSATNVTTAFTLSIALKDSSNTYGSGSVLKRTGNSVAAGNSSGHFVEVFTPSAAQRSYASGGWLFGGMSTSGTENGQVAISNLKFEVGEVATAWTEAPEDVSDDIADAAKTASDYISADSNGIKIRRSNSTYPVTEITSSAVNIKQSATSYASIGSGGLAVYVPVSGEATDVANFGTTARIGQTNSGNVTIYMYDSDTCEMDFNFSGTKLAGIQSNSGGVGMVKMDLNNLATASSYIGTYKNASTSSYIHSYCDRIEFQVESSSTVKKVTIDSSGNLTTPSISLKSDGIYHVGTKATTRALYFMDNTSNANGNGIAIGGGGAVVVGSGESAASIINSIGVTAATETTYITSDNNVYVYTACDTIANRKGFVFKTNGELEVPYAIDFSTQADQGLMYQQYNDTWYRIMRNHNNGNLSISAPSSGLYLGYENTTLVNFLNGKASLDSSGNLSLNGNVKTNNKTRGYFLKDSSNYQYPGIYDNGSNMWVGATETNSTHHKGQTYISAGHNGTNGNSTIYVSVPNEANTSATNYAVYHAGYKPSASDIGAAPTSHTHTYSQISDRGTYIYDATISRTKNTVLAAPNGSNGAASFRKIVAADIANFAGTPTAYTSGTSATASFYIDGSAGTPTVNQAIHNLSSFIICAGVWLVIAEVWFHSNSTGRRVVKLATGGADIAAGEGHVSAAAVNGTQTQIQVTRYLCPTASATYYLNCLQNSGGQLNACYRITAIRLG